MSQGVCVGTSALTMSNCESFTSNDWSNLDNQLSTMGYKSTDFSQGTKEYNSASGLIKTALAFAVIVCVTALTSAFHAMPVVYFEKLQWACFGLLALSMLFIAIALGIADVYNPISDYDSWIPLLCAPSVAAGETWFDNHLFIGPGYVMALLCLPVDLWMIQILLWPGTCCGCCCCQSIQNYFRYKDEENTYLTQGENSTPVVVGVVVGTPVMVAPNKV
jgi:hypothetical protein